MSAMFHKKILAKLRTWNQILNKNVVQSFLIEFNCTLAVFFFFFKYKSIAI